MEKENAHHNLECDGESHGRHLCYLVSQGLNLSDEQEYKALIVDPKFRCGHCGRQANGNQSLCVPVELETPVDSSRSITGPCRRQEEPVV